MFKLYAICPEKIDLFDTGFRMNSKVFGYDSVLVKCQCCSKTHVLETNDLTVLEITDNKAAKKYPAI